MWSCVTQEELLEGSSEDDFHRGIDIWVTKPQAIDKRLTHAFESHRSEGLPRCEVAAALVDVNLGPVTAEQIIADLDPVVDLLRRETGLKWNRKTPVAPEPEGHVVIICRSSHRVTFIPRSDTSAAVYRIVLSKSPKSSKANPAWMLNLELAPGVLMEDYSAEVVWYRDKLFPKLISWMRPPNEDQRTQNLMLAEYRSNLVTEPAYSHKYNELKVKYGPNLVKHWADQATTDPYKYVYEDIAIAAYILLLWEQDREKNKTAELQSFVDLGCGNGLLVYLLVQEGHRGKGIDVRKRKVWDFFQPPVTLVEEPLDPTSSRFPEYDWLIGNHSDELTPWIPWLASQSSYKTNFFLLPCCFFDFGKKFAHNDTRIGQYFTYLNYIRDVTVRCGFNVETDAMKIPSTKRVCLVGRSRSYPMSEENTFKLVRDEMVKGVETFVPRPKNIIVDNYLKMDIDLKESIVKDVTARLLSTHNPNPSGWNLGGEITLKEASQLVGKERLHALKSGSGGLRTVLKNCFQIFTVRKGVVTLRDWANNCPSLAKVKPDGYHKKRKTRRCWFFDNHPDGCPLSALNCSFLHESGEGGNEEHRS